MLDSESDGRFDAATIDAYIDAIGERAIAALKAAIEDAKQNNQDCGPGRGRDDYADYTAADLLTQAIDLLPYFVDEVGPVPPPAPDFDDE